jgi:mRNA interferase MazF
MSIQLGAVYWLHPDSSPISTDIPHPYVVIQMDAASQTVTLCALTTALQKLSMQGNVLLEAGEGNLPRQSVVEVSKQVTVKSSALGVCIGLLSESRVRHIHAGIRFVQRSSRADG